MQMFMDPKCQVDGQILEKLINNSHEVFKEIKCSKVGRGLLSKLNDTMSIQDLTKKCEGTYEDKEEIIEVPWDPFFDNTNPTDLGNQTRMKRNMPSITQVISRKLSTFQQDLFDKLEKLVDVMASIDRDQIENSAYEPKDDPFKYRIDDETRLCQKAINVTLRKLQAANLTNTEENVFKYFNVTGE